MPASASLLAAFDLGAKECVAIAGGGGKTTIMYRLAAETLAAGRTAVAGGTTRFTPPRSGEMPPVVTLVAEGDPAPLVGRALNASPVVTCVSGRGDKGRLLPISPEQVRAITAIAGLNMVVLEADGSRNRPFKAPGDGEPVIPDVATLVVSVVGLDALGQPLNDTWVHRPERVSVLSGVQEGDHVSAECIASVLLHPDGGRKCVPPGARWIPVLNKAGPSLEASGRRIAELLIAGGAATVVLATANARDPVVDVIHA